MDIQKATFETAGPNIRISLPITKFDVKRRTVSGFATMDNLDSHGDVLTKEASLKAFSEFRGNLREMHAPKAVGKVLTFEERTYVDPDNGSTHTGIWVEVYVSLGAEDTWQKVLDGTLTGFSIGGAIVDATEKFDKSSNSVQRWVDEYKLTELSLVDNPANQLCNVFSFQKSADGTMTVTGMAADIDTQNVFMCEAEGSHAAIVTKKESVECGDCSKPMRNIGWVETTDTEKSATIQNLIKRASHHDHVHVSNEFASGGLVKYNQNTNTATGSNYTITISGGNITTTGVLPTTFGKSLDQNTEGGVEVPEENKPEENAVVETTEEGATVDNVETRPTEEAAAAPSEDAEAADNSEVSEDVDLQKMFTGFADEIKSALEKSKTETNGVVEELKKSLETTTNELSTKISELETRFGALDDKVGATEKRIDSVEGDTAIRKSADLGGAEDTNATKNSVWGGAFLSVNDL